MSYIRPRHHAILTVPIFGTTRMKDEDNRGLLTHTFPVRVRRASLTLNDHNAADELEISLEWKDAAIDPRYLKNAVVEYYMGDANTFDGIDIPLDHDDTLRFMGIAVKVRRIAKVDSGFVVDMTFQDYTNLFLRSKPFPAEGIPLYSDTMASGWKRLCDHTGWEDPNSSEDNKIVSNVTNLSGVAKDSSSAGLVFEGNIDQSKTFGSVVPQRYTKLAKFDSSIEPTADAWSVWQRCVGSLGLITFIRKDQCVVTTSAAYYIDDPSDPNRPKPPVMVWGKDILSLEEDTHSQFEGKGVCITSYDYTQERTLEAYWPPRDKLDSPIQTKRVVALKKHKNDDPAIRSNRYDFIEYNGVTDFDALLAIAKRAYDERSRQELTGVLRTCELFVHNQEGLLTTDILSLRSGDEIQIKADPSDREALAKIGSSYLQLLYLMDRGYQEGVARLIVDNMAAYPSLVPVYHIRSIHMLLDTDADSGTFEIDIHVCNRVSVDGDIAADENIDNTKASQ